MRYLLCVLGVMTAFILAGGWAIRYDDVLRQRRAANLYSWAASWRGMTRSCFQWLQYWPVVPELRLARCLVVLYGLGVALIWQACWSSDAQPNGFAKPFATRRLGTELGRMVTTRALGGNVFIHLLTDLARTTTYDNDGFGILRFITLLHPSSFWCR